MSPTNPEEVSQPRVRSMSELVEELQNVIERQKAEDEVIAQALKILSDRASRVNQFKRLDQPSFLSEPQLTD